MMQCRSILLPFDLYGNNYAHRYKNLTVVILFLTILFIFEIIIRGRPNNKNCIPFHTIKIIF